MAFLFIIQQHLEIGEYPGARLIELADDLVVPRHLLHIALKRMVKHLGLPQPNIPRQLVHDLPLLMGASLLRLASVFDGPQTEEEQRADKDEDQAKRSKDE